MAVTPTGILSLPLYNLQTIIANSSNFRTWTSTADVASARTRIYMVKEDTDNVTRPFARISQNDDYTAESISGDVGLGYIDSGSLELYFENDVTESDPTDAEFQFTNNIGAIMTDIQNLSGTTSDYITISSWNLVELRRESWSEEPIEDYYYCLLTVNWAQI